MGGRRKKRVINPGTLCRARELDYPDGIDLFLYQHQSEDKRIVGKRKIKTDDPQPFIEYILDQDIEISCCTSSHERERMISD